MSYRIFIVQLLLAAVVLYALAAVAIFIARSTMPWMVWLLIPVYGAFTLFLYRMIAKASEKSPHRFVSAVNASVVIKLMVTATIVGIYMALKMPHPKALALAAMGIYLVYTFVLVRALLPVLKGGGKK
ncbi:MAG: hypothetical protein SH856_05675 [Flavobacteriales bacterium]|nr:hypothetical protein [Flavobacteriales bacterium]